MALQTVNININQGEKSTVNVALYDKRSGTKTIIPSEDVSEVVLEVRTSPDRTTQVLTTLEPNRVGDNYVVELPASITGGKQSILYGDIKFTLTSGLSKYGARLKYNITTTTTE